MPPQRSKVCFPLFTTSSSADADHRVQLRRTATLTGSFYDKSGAIADSTVASPAATSVRDADMADATSNRGGNGRGGGVDSDDECCLSGYGELSSDAMFMLPPSPTQTIQYRYPAYRTKLAKMNKKRHVAAGGTGKTKSSAYHKSVSRHRVS